MNCQQVGLMHGSCNRTTQWYCCWESNRSEILAPSKLWSKCPYFFKQPTGAGFEWAVDRFQSFTMGAASYFFVFPLSETKLVNLYLIILRRTSYSSSKFKAYLYSTNIYSLVLTPARFFSVKSPVKVVQSQTGVQHICGKISIHFYGNSIHYWDT